MGCRPSRRAVACVRVAGEGPWGSGRSNRPRSFTGDNGVKLRHRGSRRSRDEGKDEGGTAVHTRDRYSAPPVDRQFPPHSCTSAVYEHGCCGTSRITLRLSKNGSTLEIEKCDFQHGIKSCRLCGTSEGPSMEQSYTDVPLRAQSAPNLTMTSSDHSRGGASMPPVSQRSNRHVVQSEPHPPPPPVRHMDRLAAGTNVIGVSPPESVCTATRIDVDVESIPRPSFSNDNSSHHGASANVTRQASHDSPMKPATLEQLYFLHHSHEYSEALSHSHFENGYEDMYSCPYSPSSEELSRLLRDADTLLMNDYNPDSEVSDLTKLNSIHAGTQHEDDSEDSDIECPNRLDICSSKSSVEDKIRPIGHSGHGSPDSFTDAHSHTDNAQEIISVLQQDSNNGTFTADSCDEVASYKDNRPHTHGATDYRIRMLGAQKCVITSQLSRKESPKTCVMKKTKISDSAILETGRQEVSMVNGEDVAGMTTIAVKMPQYSETVTDTSCHENIAVKMPQYSETVTDTSCHEEREGKAQRSMPAPGTVPVFHYADVHSELVDNTQKRSSPGLDSLC